MAEKDSGHDNKPNTSQGQDIPGSRSAAEAGATASPRTGYIPRK